MARLTFVVLAVSLVVLQQGAEANQENCVSSCKGLPVGDYQSCRGCTVYASCIAQGTLEDNIPCGSHFGAPLVWNDVKKSCDYRSPTCGGLAPPNRCVTSCDGLPYGDYQSCRGCNVYVSCDAAGCFFDAHPCAWNLVWDDILKRCDQTSQTCGGHAAQSVAAAAPVIMLSATAAPVHVSSTGSRCIRSCADLAYGDYQSCQGCNVYASCSAAGELIDNRPCASSNGAPLVWDDNKKSCQSTSPTCSSVDRGLGGSSVGRNRCVSSCTGLAIGNYQSCNGCNVYVSCDDEEIMHDNRPCPTSLVWDDKSKRCKRISSTCP